MDQQYNQYDVMNEDIRKIEAIYGEHLNSGKYGFKSCNSKWIIVLEKLEDTVTSEINHNYHEIKCALFRGSKFKVAAIFNKFDPLVRLNTITHKDGKIHSVYNVDEIIESKNFSTKSYSMTGISYFVTIIPAFYFGLNCEMEDGTYTTIL